MELNRRQRRMKYQRRMTIQRQLDQIKRVDEQVDAGVGASVAVLAVAAAVTVVVGVGVVRCGCWRGELGPSLIIGNERKKPPVGDVNIIKNHQKSERCPTLKLMMDVMNDAHGSAFISVTDAVDTTSPRAAQNDALITIITFITLITSAGHPFRLSFRSLSGN